MSQTTLSHVDQNGQANMVDVTSKQATSRQASAMARVMMKSETLDMIACNQHAKGDVLAVSRIAGIQAAKKCADLIPLCHPLMLTKVAIDFNVDREKGWVEIQSLCRLTGQTGVEMEALTAVSVAALTLFDMCKAVDPHMVITEMKVLTKQGGKSGDWQREVNS